MSSILFKRVTSHVSRSIVYKQINPIISRSFTTSNENNDADNTAPPSIEEVTQLKKDLESCTTEIGQLNEDIKKMKDLHLRDLAEMENVRTRARIDMENTKKFAVTGFAKDIIEVADTISLAIATTREGIASSDMKDDKMQSLLEGVELTEKILLGVFEKHHIKKYHSLGEVFDCNIHDGIYQYQDPTKTPGTVGNVMKEGYMMHDRVLRVAAVGTIQAPPKTE